LPAIKTVGRSRGIHIQQIKETADKLLRDLSIENNVRDLLRKIDGALDRMSKKTYGVCIVCGKPIEKARVRALPYVELCLKDAQAQTRSR
jgi:RNA polymerase-binding transcription factor DksA